MVLRALLSMALLLGSGVGDWPQAGAPAQESCCCGSLAGMPDACPCPKPEGNRTPTQSSCGSRTVVVAAVSQESTQATPRTEPRPVPATWARSSGLGCLAEAAREGRGRAPDLGRHLAQLSTFRI